MDENYKAWRASMGEPEDWRLTIKALEQADGTYRYLANLRNDKMELTAAAIGNSREEALQKLGSMCNPEFAAVWVTVRPL